MDSYFIVIWILLLTLAVILNALGIYCIYKTKISDIQKVILINLSIAEIIIAITAGAGRTLEVFDHGVRNHKESMFLALFYVGVNFVYYLIMIYISIDRLLCIFWNLKYKYYMTIKTIQKIILFIWFLGFISSIPLYLVPFKDATLILGKVCVILDGAFIIISILAYAVIAFKLRERVKKIPSMIRRNSNQSLSKRKHLVVPLCIVLSFVLFYIIPDILFAFEMFTKNRLLFNIVYCWWCTSLSCDPLIYIFFNKKVRSVARRSSKRRKSSIESTEMRVLHIFKKNSLY